MDAAAVALRLGYNPMHFLALVGSDRVLASKILNKASDRFAEEETARMRAFQNAVQNGVAKAFGSK